MSLGSMFGGLFGAGSLLSGISTGMDAYGAYRQAQADKQAAYHNAGIEDANAAYYETMAHNALDRGDKEAGDHRRALDVMKGQQRVGFAASGVKVDQGSALDVAVDTAKWGEYDAQTILYNSQVEAAGYSQKAWNSKQSAEMLRATGRSPSLAAGGVILNGASAAASRYGNW
ncbi:MAG: hypothetical protein LIP77_07775 [Planctomycetes bacterium]|nr:hypothetical protein [Planctomycetota bacterium]